jgi:hypothetical protein
LEFANGHSGPLASSSSTKMVADQESHFENRPSANHDLIDAYSTRIVEVHRDITQKHALALCLPSWIRQMQLHLLATGP